MHQMANWALKSISHFQYPNYLPLIRTEHDFLKRKNCQKITSRRTRVDGRNALEQGIDTRRYTRYISQKGVFFPSDKSWMPCRCHHLYGRKERVQLNNNSCSDAFEWRNWYHFEIMQYSSDSFLLRTNGPFESTARWQLVGILHKEKKIGDCIFCSSPSSCIIIHWRLILAMFKHQWWWTV